MRGLLLLIEVQTKIENECFRIFEWFRNNFLKANGTKYYVKIKTDNTMQTNFEGSVMSNGKNF